MSVPEQSPILLDTNVVSELARPQPAAEVVAALQRVSERTYISTVTVGELRLGVELLDHGARREMLQKFVDAVEDAYALRVLSLSAAVAREYAASVARLRRSGTSISVNDAYIAATAAVNGAELWTRNLQDFRAYPGIRVRSPWAEAD